MDIDEQIRERREFNLSILKPSKKDLDHGLQLHKESIVCDAFAFAPFGPPDYEELHALSQRGGGF